MQILKNQKIGLEGNKQKRRPKMIAFFKKKWSLCYASATSGANT